MGCLVALGVLLMAVSCLAVFGATGAITSTRGGGGRAAAAAERPPPGEPTTAPREAESKPEATPTERAAAAAATKPAAESKPSAESKPEAEGATPRPAEKPIPAGTVPPKSAPAGSESSIAQRLDRETSAGGLTLRALGAAKTSQGDRSVLAIYVRLQN